MNTKLRYTVIDKGNPFAQKTITVTVPSNAQAFNIFEETVKAKLGDNITFNHAGKIVVVNN